MGMQLRCFLVWVGIGPAVLAAAADAHAAPVTAALANPGFEAPATVAAPIPGWHHNGQGAYRAALDPDAPHGGKTALRLELTGPGQVVQVYCERPTVEGKDYRASRDEEWRVTYRVRAEGPGTLSCLLRAAPTTHPDTHDGLVNWWTLGGKEPGARTGWVRREFLADVPKGTGFTYLLFHLSGLAGSKAWLDDVALEKVRDLPAVARPNPPRKLRRLVLLNHPYAVESMLHHDPAAALKLRSGELGGSDLLAWERKVSARWPGEVHKLGPDDALILNGLGVHHVMTPNGPMAPAWRAAREHLGGRLVVTFSAPGPVEELGRVVRQKLLENGYTYDPTTLVTEAWGQSFEGCVPNYAGHVAAGLGLSNGFRMRYDLTVPDAPFALTAKFVERLAVGNTDVSLYLFEAKDGQRFGVYFPGVVPDKGPARRVKVDLSAAQVRLTNKLGEPRAVPSAEGGFTVPLVVDGQGEPVYVWGRGIDRAAFRTALTGARVE